jgi:ribosomal protein S18 acetylase RimI-like enzyme
VAERGRDHGVTPEHAVRRAEVADAGNIGRLLHDFNTEYDEYTPGAEAMGRRIAELLESGDVTVLIGGDGPDGLALLRFRPSLWSESLDCYLEELYVVPGQRGRGLGQALMEAAIETARAEGAGYMDLGTAETDTAARALYEKMGFSRTEGKPDGPINYFYEREL